MIGSEAVRLDVLTGQEEVQVEVENMKMTAAKKAVDEAQTEGDGLMLATEKAVDATEDDNLDSEDDGKNQEEVRRRHLWRGSYYLDVPRRWESGKINNQAYWVCGADLDHCFQLTILSYMCI